MPYCPRCGVEVEASVRECPLCSTNIPSLPELVVGEPHWPLERHAHDPSKHYPSRSESHGRAFLILVALFVTAAGALLATDLVVMGGITWSRWPLIGLGAALGLLASGLAWHRTPRRWVPATAIVIGGLLLALDACDDGVLGWAPSLGLPILFLTLALWGLGIAGLRWSRRVGYNLFGVLALLIGLELVGIDALVGWWTQGTALLTWSVVTSLVLGPLTLLFFLLHLLLRHTPDLKRIFHY